MHEALRDELAGCVGAAHVLTEPDLTAGFEHDVTGRFGGRAAGWRRRSPAGTRCT